MCIYCKAKNEIRVDIPKDSSLFLSKSFARKYIVIEASTQIATKQRKTPMKVVLDIIYPKPYIMNINGPFGSKTSVYKLCPFAKAFPIVK